MGRSRLFAPLALTTALLTIGLIIFGAVVRVTDSGLGCGNHWPSCNGTFFPPLDNLTAWIEWLHRLFALLIGLFGLATLAVALRVYRKQNRMVLIATVIAALMFVVQSALGALVVVLDLPPTFVTLHLAAAMLLLGALLLAVIYAVYTPAKSTRSDSFATLAYVTTALSLVIIMTGALVRGSGATLACTDWPLCNGQVLPFEQGTLQTIHMFHRFAVAGLGLALFLLVRQAAQLHRTGIARNLVVGAFLAYLAQAGIGALYVFSSAAPLWGAAHVGFAATTWALLVALSVIETMNNREKEPVTEWQSKALSN